MHLLHHALSLLACIHTTCNTFKFMHGFLLFILNYRFQVILENNRTVCVCVYDVRFVIENNWNIKNFENYQSNY